MGQRVDVNFCFKLLKCPSETLERLQRVDGESHVKEATDVRSPRSEQCWSAFSTSGVSSTLNLCPKGPLLIIHSTWKCWKRHSDAVRRKRGELWGVRSLILHQDNAQTHPTLRVSQFLAGKGISGMDHPQYSPELALPDFWLFSELRSVLNGKWTSDVEDIKSSVRKFWQTFLFRILKTVLKSCRSAGNSVKNWREINLKNSRLLISTALKINS
jgi:hypothetical protein